MIERTEIREHLRTCVGPDKTDRLLQLAAEAARYHPGDSEAARAALYDRIHGDDDRNLFTNEAVNLLTVSALASL